MQDQFQGRRFIIQIIFVFAAIFLIGKAAQLQLFDSSYQKAASSYVVQELNIYPSRGLIFDRDSNLLVNNEAMYDLMVTYNQVSPDMDTAKFCDLLGISKQAFLKNLNKDFRSNKYSPFKPFVFLSKISSETYAKFQESLYEFPGFYAELRNVRGYEYNSGAHVLGYTGEVSPLKLEQDKYYRRGDYIGISGLELAYEKELRGRRGVQYLLRNNLGRVVGPYENGRRDTAAVSGYDLYSTLDIELQRYGEKLLQNKRGAIIAIEPATGEILAMVSAPSYNPNLLRIGRERGEAFAKLSQDEAKPLFNRALSAQYPPGSIFKPVVALIAMQEEVSSPFRTIGCRGGYYYKSLHVGCHGHPTATSVSMAIQHSCNAYFCQVFRDIVDKNGFSRANIGLDTFNSHLYSFGLGRRLESDIPNQLPGNVPTSEYYTKLYKGNSWASPYIISLGIGQGELLMTPLQMANMTATIANRGFYYPPHLAKFFKHNNEIMPIPENLRTKNSTKINREYFSYVVDGMEDVVKAGTARIAQIPDVSVCGKTGTAENPHGEDHSVFVAFAPKENPKIAIAVFVENASWGGTYAAPIASLMIEQYLKGEVSDSRKYLEKRMFDAVILP